MSPDEHETTGSTDRFADPERRYRLDELLATGGMGEVWRSTDTRLDRAVAVKLLKRELAGDPTFRTRFGTEARNAASLHHASIAAVFDFGDGSRPGEQAAPLQPWLVMELVRGKPLSELLAGGALDAAQTRDLLAGVAEGLGVAHADGIVHRDVKPANLIVTPQRSVKITDFGISRAVDSAAVTQTGEVLGTPHYLSPEQAAGEQATARSDVYALGVVLHECLSGVRPFDEGSPVQTALAHLRKQPPPLPDDTPSGLAAVVDKALAKEPSDRYEDGAALAAALRRADLGTPPIGAGSSSSTTRVMPGLGAAAAGAAGGAALGAAGGAAAAGRGGSLSGRPPGQGAQRPGNRPPGGPPPRQAPRQPPRQPPRQSPTKPGWVPVAWAIGLVVLLLIVAVTILGTQGAERTPVSGPGQDRQTVVPEPEPEPEAEPTEAPEEPEVTTVTVDAGDYLGRDEKDAKDDLEDLGLDVDTVDVANDGGFEEKTVAAVDPTGEVEEGSTVVLSVYDKPEPPPEDEAEGSDDGAQGRGPDGNGPPGQDDD